MGPCRYSIECRFLPADRDNHRDRCTVVCCPLVSYRANAIAVDAFAVVAAGFGVGNCVRAVVVAGDCWNYYSIVVASVEVAVVALEAAFAPMLCQ